MTFFFFHKTVICPFAEMKFESIMFFGRSISGSFDKKLLGLFLTRIIL